MNTCHNRLGATIRRSGLLLAGAAILAGLAACDRAPEGQVVAVVNGEEITTDELNGELPPQANSAEGDKATRNAALDRVVERLLLAEAAREQGVDSSPEYILREKKLRETLLVQMLNEKLAREIKDPSAQDIDKMIAGNPQAFSGRTVYALDQLVFQAPKRPGIIEALEPTKTMDEVAAVLNRAGIKFQRGSTTVDSVTLTPQMFAQFQRIGTSEPMIMAAGPSVTVAKIVAERAVPITGNAARPLAGTGYRREETQKRLRELLKSARGEAEITYQSGYGAPSAGASTATTAPAKP
ncbi:hypothetical protein ACWPM1_13660 [Tsuneonella sp. HG249]